MLSRFVGLFCSCVVMIRREYETGLHGGRGEGEQLNVEEGRRGADGLHRFAAPEVRMIEAVASKVEKTATAQRRRTMSDAD